MPGYGEERIFVRARRPFRPRYSRTEAKLGALVIAGLAAVAAWVAWRGTQADPELSIAIALPQRGPQEADRGPMPAGVAPEGFREGKVSAFDAQDLYLKIDGREGYYKSFGFRSLHCLTLTAAAGEPSIDLELYDLGSPENALGAAAGELPAGAAPELRDGALSLVDRNALYFARGRHYLRAIGSVEGEPVRRALAVLRDRFAALPAGAPPWQYPLFAALGVAPGKVRFEAENAFSFGFADAFHVGDLADGDTELFVSLRADPARAAALAERLSKGFADHGTPLGVAAGARWSADRYLHRASAAAAAGRFVYGVHSAADAKAGAALLAAMAPAVRALPAGPPAAVARPGDGSARR